MSRTGTPSFGPLVQTLVRRRSVSTSLRCIGFDLRYLLDLRLKPYSPCIAGFSAGTRRVVIGQPDGASDNLLPHKPISFSLRLAGRHASKSAKSIPSRLAA